MSKKNKFNPLVFYLTLDDQKKWLVTGEEEYTRDTPTIRGLLTEPIEKAEFIKQVWTEYYFRINGKKIIKVNNKDEDTIFRLDPQCLLEKYDLEREVDRFLNCRWLGGGEPFTVVKINKLKIQDDKLMWCFKNGRQVKINIFLHEKHLGCVLASLIQKEPEAWPQIKSTLQPLVKKLVIQEINQLNLHARAEIENLQAQIDKRENVLTLLH